MVKQLKREKLIRVFYRDGLRGLRLTSAAKKLLLDDDPAQFRHYLTGSTDTNRLKSEITRRRRLHRMAEVLVTMYNAEAAVFQSEKPPLFSSPPRSGFSLEWPAYYSARELKDMGQVAVKVRNSRSTGILLTPECVYAIYNVGPFLQTKWEYRAEMRLKALLQTELCQRRIPQCRGVAPQGLVFGQSMSQLPSLMEDGAASPQNHFLLDGSYDRFHYLTCNQHGELLLQLLFDPGRRAKLDAILRENLAPGRPGWSMEHDGMDQNNTPVLFGYLCDMPRIRRFDTALNLQQRAGILICFDFQEEALRQVCGQRVKMQSLDFEKVKALFGGEAP